VIEARNQADQMIYGLEKILRENKDKISDDDAKRIQAEIENTRKAVQGENLEQIKKAVESLANASHKMTEMLYQQASRHQQAQPQDKGAGQGQGAASAPSEDEVIDAEVVDEDRKN